MTATESRVPRFAELDAAIKAEDATVMPKPKSGRARKGPRPTPRARRPRKRQLAGKAVEGEALSRGREFVARLAEITRRMFADELNRSEFVRLAQEFRSAVVPKRTPGRRPDSRITRAYQAWKDGKRGVALLREHVPRWEKLGYYRRRSEERKLMAAINSRWRRDRNRQRVSDESMCSSRVVRSLDP